MKDTKHIRRDFNFVPGWDVGALGVPRGSNNFFSNMVMWYIKSTGMRGRSKCKKHFHPDGIFNLSPGSSPRDGTLGH